MRSTSGTTLSKIEEYIWERCFALFDRWPRIDAGSYPQIVDTTLCYAIVLPGRKSGFRVGFQPDAYRESFNIGPPTGRRPAGEPDFLPGSTIA